MRGENDDILVWPWQGDVGVVVGTGLALTEPGQETGPTEPVATDGLLGISLAQQADRTLELGRVVNEGVLVTSLVVVLGVVLGVTGLLLS